MMKKNVCMMALAALLLPSATNAQLSTNADKFLGNITTGGQVDYGKEKFYQLWNQITPENETKWDACEPSRNNFTFGGADRSANYAKQHNFPFKFHTLVWGSQYPNWIMNLSQSEQYKAIVEWFDAVKKHYPNLEIIDVVNEAISGHAPAPYRAALGGEGKTGYDWIIKAFELAHERWPDAILVYNDYNTFQWNTDQFIDLVRTIRDAGAPVDAYGCQSHDLTDITFANFKSAMTKIQNALKMPMYSTEYDIGTTDDAQQLKQYKDQIPYMWESDYCAGITLWGYIYGHTWIELKDNQGNVIERGISGIIKDGKDRPAMTWLREYMASDAAKNAKSPFPGMKKEASVYVKPAALNVTKGDTVPVTINARLRTKTINRVEFYVNNALDTIFYEAPYAAQVVLEKVGKADLKAIVVATDSSRYERLSGITAYNPRAPYKNVIELPGTLQAENFDSGADGIAFHDVDGNNEGGTSYRSNGGGVDIVSGNGGYAIGYTKAGEWLEYTVNVKEAGIYSYEAYVSSQDGGGAMSFQLSNSNGLTALTATTVVPKTGNWNTYKVMNGRFDVPLEEGQQIIRLSIDKANNSFNVDKIIFKRIEVDEDMEISLTADPEAGTVGENAVIKANVASPTSHISSVKFYIDNVLLKNVIAEPFETTYKPTAKGEVNFTAIATDAEGKQSKIAKLTLKVSNKRTPYSGSPITIPGTIQAENFDKGGEGMSFHDSDSNREGDQNYRNDGEGVDFVKGNGGTAIGYTAAGEWLEYTVNVKEAGEYSYEAHVSSGTTGSAFTIGLVKNGSVTSLAKVNVPKTGDNNWDTYKVVTGKLNKQLEEGQQILRFTINGASCNIDKVVLKCTVPAAIQQITADQPTTNNVYNLAGQKVGSSYKGIVIKNGRKVVNK